MPEEPALSADALLDRLRGRFEQMCRDVAAAVNQAPAGQVINASEEKVRDLLADSPTGHLIRPLSNSALDAAQAAFSPSAPSPDPHAAPQQRDPINIPILTINGRLSLSRRRYAAPGARQFLSARCLARPGRR